jgi:hypothetical protein
MFVPTPLADIYVGTRPRQQDTNKIEDALDCIRRKHLSQLPMLANMRLRGSLLVEKAALLYRAGRPISAGGHIVAALLIYPFRNAAFFRMLWRSVRKATLPTERG